MQEQGRPKVTSEEEARELLLAEQRRRGETVTNPDATATVETAKGWAFYNVNGYLRTVTRLGHGAIITAWNKCCGSYVRASAADPGAAGP
jgi:hypothetical protein